MHTIELFLKDWVNWLNLLWLIPVHKLKDKFGKKNNET
jgi:hypothetical protein